MSTNLYIMVACRCSIIDKFDIKSIWRKESDKYVEETILPIYAGSLARDFMHEMADKYGLAYKKEYFTNPPDLTRPGFLNNETYEISPYFVKLDYFAQEFEQLVNTPIVKNEDNEEYYDDLVDNRLCKIDFLGRLLGAIDCFDQSYNSIERYLVYYYE